MRISNDNRGRATFSSLHPLILFFLFWIVPCLNARSALSSGTMVHLPASKGSAEAAITAIQDTLSAKTDTVHDRQDTTVARDTAAARKDTLEIIMSTEGLNTDAGFRVQIGSTQDLSAAVNERAKAETLLTGYNVYIIYDSPYYKVRVGDFRARYDAAQAANFIAGHGFPGAWVVPDNVFKDPQKKGR